MCKLDVRGGKNVCRTDSRDVVLHVGVALFFHQEAESGLEVPEIASTKRFSATAGSR